MFTWLKPKENQDKDAFSNMGWKKKTDLISSQMRYIACFDEFFILAFEINWVDALITRQAMGLVKLIRWSLNPALAVLVCTCLGFSTRRRYACNS